MGEWNTVDGDKSYRNIVEPRGQGRRNQKISERSYPKWLL
jgi:hypothetical protein